MIANIVSYQCKEKHQLLLLQLIGGGLFAVNMFLLGAVMGGILNIIAVFRAVVYMRREHSAWWNWLFGTLYGISYLLTFVVFGKSPTAFNLLTEFLPLLGMMSMTIGFSKSNTRAIRLCGFINSPCWLIYNCINFSIGGIICEVISLVSILFAVLRLDKKAT